MVVIDSAVTPKQLVVTAAEVRIGFALGMVPVLGAILLSVESMMAW